MFDTEVAFIHEVFKGILANKEFINLFITSFFNRTHASRTDNLLYQILTYITIFRIKEIPIHEFT